MYIYLRKDTANIQQYDPLASIESSVGEISRDWDRLYGAASSGQKAWLTQMKNHYLRIIQEEPEEAARLLAMHEHNLSLIRQNGLLNDKAV
jgi:hypothetical protein